MSYLTILQELCTDLQTQSNYRGQPIKLEVRNGFHPSNYPHPDNKFIYYVTVIIDGFTRFRETTPFGEQDDKGVIQELLAKRILVIAFDIGLTEAIKAQKRFV